MSKQYILYPKYSIGLSLTFIAPISSIFKLSDVEIVSEYILRYVNITYKLRGKVLDINIENLRSSINKILSQYIGTKTSLIKVTTREEWDIALKLYDKFLEYGIDISAADIVAYIEMNLMNTVDERNNDIAKLAMSIKDNLNEGNFILNRFSSFLSFKIRFSDQQYLNHSTYIESLCEVLLKIVKTNEVYLKPIYETTFVDCITTIQAFKDEYYRIITSALSGNSTCKELKDAFAKCESKIQFIKQMQFIKTIDGKELL